MKTVRELRTVILKAGTPTKWMRPWICWTVNTVELLIVLNKGSAVGRSTLGRTWFHYGKTSYDARIEIGYLF